MYKYRPYKIDEYGSPTFAALLCVQSKGYFLFSSIYGESLSKIFFRLSCMEEEGWVIEKTGVADEYEEAQDLSSQDLLEEALTSEIKMHSYFYAHNNEELDDDIICTKTKKLGSCTFSRRGFLTQLLF